MAACFLLSDCSAVLPQADSAPGAMSGQTEAPFLEGELTVRLTEYGFGYEAYRVTKREDSVTAD